LWLLATNPGFYNHDELDLLRSPPTDPWWRWQVFTDASGIFYRPLGYIVFVAELAFSSGNAWIAHTIGVLHHLVNFVMLGILLGRLGLPRRVAVMTVLPSTVPAVAWVAGTYDLSALTFLCGAALALLSHGRACLLAVPIYLLALLCKESAVTFVVGAALIAWRRRHDQERLAVFAAFGTIALTAAAFTLWRMTYGAASADYSLSISLTSALRFLQYAAFLFAIDKVDPGAVSGASWLGLLGTCALAVCAWRGSRQWLMAGVACGAAALLPVSLIPKVEGHYLYLATPGILLIIAAALRDRSRTVRATLSVLLVVSIAHSFRIAMCYRTLGAAMNNLGAAYDLQPDSDTSFNVYGEPWVGRAAARRYQVHTLHCGRRPVFRLLNAPHADAWTLRGDGTLEAPTSGVTPR
jgi:hypothetical protein